MVVGTCEGLSRGSFDAANHCCPARTINFGIGGEVAAFRKASERGSTIRHEAATVTEGSGVTIGYRRRELRQIASGLLKSKLTPLQACRAIINNRSTDSRARSFFCGLPNNEKHYWIASLYALMLPKARRQRLGAYFTPPNLARYAIDTLIDAGVRLGNHCILDPASGGAAFLVPLAARIADQGRRRGANGETTLQAVESSIVGVEIDPGLATLSKLLISDLLREEIDAAGRKPRIYIERANTLSLPLPGLLFDAAIGNPPYGRIFRPSRAMLETFAPVISDGYVNLYALFLEQAIRWVRPGGVICMIVPMSFIGGPCFAALRKRILETSDVLRLDPIDKRSALFLDVLCDVCVLALRKKGARVRAVVPKSSLLVMGQSSRPLGKLEIPDHASGRIWALPEEKKREELFQPGLETLADYGYIAKTGYFVWNREQDRYRVGKKPRLNEVPLFWAHNVKANCVCRPYDGKPDSNYIGFVTIAREHSALIYSDAIILQRTSNRRQARRLIGAIIRRKKVPGQRAFVTENHTITVVPDPAKTQKITIKMLCRLLNAKAVDTRFRRISGSVSVSTKVLRQLPLPAAMHVRTAFTRGIDDDEAAEIAYAHSVVAGMGRFAGVASG